MLPLTNWANFYVIVGSSAGALTGLTFVVISLIAGRRIDEARTGAECVHHANHRPFWRGAPGDGTPQCPVDIACSSRAPADPGKSWSAGLCGSRLVATTARDLLSAGVGRLALVRGAANCRVNGDSGLGDTASQPCHVGAIRYRCGVGAAPGHWHPQRVGCRHLSRVPAAAVAASGARPAGT